MLIHTGKLASSACILRMLTIIACQSLDFSQTMLISDE